MDLRKVSCADNELVSALCKRGLLVRVGLRECNRITKEVLDVLILNCPYLAEVTFYIYLCFLASR